MQSWPLLFWIIAALLAVAVGGLLVLALVRVRGQGMGDAEYDLRVYRDQLKEVDRDVARGTVAEPEAERVRVEVSRRLLDADRAARANSGPAPASRPLSYAVAAMIALFLIAGSLALYDRLGAPGYGDLPIQLRIAEADAVRANRPDQKTAEADLAARMPPQDPTDPRYLELMTRLRAAVTANPKDLRGQMLLARNEAALGNFAAAQAAQSQVIALKGDGVGAIEYADLADLMILATGGYVSPQAEAALREALQRDPGNGAARYYLGLSYVQTGRPDLGLQLWRVLLAESTPDAPWVPPIRAQIEEVAALAGVRFQLPPEATLPGPSSADVAAASEMNAEDRQAMIRTMVEGLNERLASDGGTPDEWARLIGALGVLNEPDRAAAIWAEAQQAFAASPEALATILVAARRAGLAQ